MDIAIIGAGNVGRALAGSASRAGHTVTISSTDPQDAQAVAQATGARAAPSNREAIDGAQIVILAVPYDAVEGIVAEAGSALDGKILVDVTNRLNVQNPPAAIDGTSNAENIQARAANARVVKAFNTALASRQADPVVDGVPVDGFVAGDDAEAQAAVLELVRSIGFRPIDAGGLGMARALEAMGLLNITLQIRNNWPWQAGWKLVGPTG
ncbi:MAG: NADPH-dependent F420 reductase [Chloroflexota bacterium]